MKFSVKFNLRIHRIVSVLLVLLVFQICVQAQQEPADSVCPQRDLQDVIRKWRNKPLNTNIAKTSSLLLVPTIGSNPATGFSVGVGGQYAFIMPESKKFSMINGSLQFTSKNQYVFMLKNSIYSKKEKIFFTGDWRFLIYSQSTYGLGTNSPEGGILDYQYNLGGLETSSDSLAQPMNYNFVRFHQSVTFKVKESIYLGFGYYFDGYADIKDHKLNLNPDDSLITSHYAYNTYYGFDTKNYFSSAINATFIIDKRDNMIQPYKGYFLKLDWRGAFEFLGSEKDASMFSGEWRSFHNVSKKNPAHLIAFWALADLPNREISPIWCYRPLHMTNGAEARAAIPRAGSGGTTMFMVKQNTAFLFPDVVVFLVECSSLMPPPRTMLPRT